MPSSPPSGDFVTHVSLSYECKSVTHQQIVTRPSRTPSGLRTVPKTPGDGGTWRGSLVPGGETLVSENRRDTGDLGRGLLWGVGRETWDRTRRPGRDDDQRTYWNPFSTEERTSRDKTRDRTTNLYTKVYPLDSGVLPVPNYLRNLSQEIIEGKTTETSRDVVMTLSLSRSFIEGHSREGGQSQRRRNVTPIVTWTPDVRHLPLSPYTHPPTDRNTGSLILTRPKKGHCGSLRDRRVLTRGPSCSELTKKSSHDVGKMFACSVQESSVP